jgi:hypothetical protein
MCRTDSSLCIPRKIASGLALISADVESISVTRDNVDGLADKVCLVVNVLTIHVDCPSRM